MARRLDRLPELRRLAAAAVLALGVASPPSPAAAAGSAAGPASHQVACPGVLASAPAWTATARLGVFPPYVPGGSANGNARDAVNDLVDTISLAARPGASAQMEFDYRSTSVKLPPNKRLWHLGSYSGRPNVPPVRGLAEEVGVDFILMFRFNQELFGTNYSDFFFNLYLIDVVTGKTALFNGYARQPRPTVETAIDAIQRLWHSCEHVAIRAATS